jgi:hypothetical protein
MSIIEEVANILDKIEYGEDISPIDMKYAKCNDAVIVFGASDDLLEFRGAINDEVGCYGGGMVYFNRSGELRSECGDDYCPYFAKLRANASKIKAIWGAGGYAWTYETDIPHETFEMTDDGCYYCRGIVFLLSDVTP